MRSNIPKSSQDLVGKWLSKWRNHKVAKELKPPFLDLACGDNILVEKIEGGYGIDIMNYGSTDLVIKNFYELPFKTNSFNSVSIIASLNYFEYPDKVLSECTRVLRYGGIIILTLLNPLVGKLWHLLREPWVTQPGFSYQQLEVFIHRTGLHITKKTKFMFRMNNLYILTK